MNDSDRPHIENITGVILAGGRAKRMGSVDKGLLKLHGKPMIEYIIDALRPQVGTMVISANRNLDKYQQYGFTVFEDILGDYYGPLAGMASAVKNTETEYVVTVPCDAPLLPEGLVHHLYQNLHAKSADLCVAHDGKRIQPVFALCHRDLLPSMLEYLTSGGRKLETWTLQQNTALADFSAEAHAFLNINTPQDQTALEAQLRDETLYS